jgi:CubicO group peptidase (beta-lactamase class C family)
MRLFCLFIVLVTSVSSWSQVEKLKKLDSLFTPSGNANQPGGVVCVLKGGEVIYRKAIGLANISQGTPNSFEFKYDLASMAKQFTAMCIALLEEQGKISTEDPLIKYYPEFQFTKEIKVKNLIDHTSGIREAYVLAVLSGKANLRGELKQKFNTKAYLLEVLRREKDLNFQPGSELAYTNINYILLADIVEQISKQPFHVFADSAIFKPLQMNNTFYRTKPDLVIPGEAVGYLAVGNNKFKPQKATGGILGDGKMVSTIDDLIKWEQNFRHNKLGKADQALADKLYTSSKLNNGELTHYGYGLWNREYRGLKTVSHGGDDGRFTSFILKFPEQGLVVICLSNSSLYNNTESTAYQIADILLDDKLQPNPKPKEYNYISLPPEKLTSWVGLYKRVDSNGLAQLRKISLTGNLSVSTSYYHDGLSLKPIADTAFIATNRTGSNVSFTFEQTPESVIFEEQFMSNAPRRFEKVQQEKIKGQRYAGTYVNKSTGARLKVKPKGTELLAKKGAIRIPLLPFGDNQFYATKNDALFVFQLDTNGQVVSIKVNASDFRNFVFERVE